MRSLEAPGGAEAAVALVTTREETVEAPASAAALFIQLRRLVEKSSGPDLVLSETFLDESFGTAVAPTREFGNLV